MSEEARNPEADYAPDDFQRDTDLSAIANYGDHPQSDCTCQPGEACSGCPPRKGIDRG